MNLTAHKNMQKTKPVSYMLSGSGLRFAYSVNWELKANWNIDHILGLLIK